MVTEWQLRAARPLDLPAAETPQDVLPPVPRDEWDEGVGTMSSGQSHVSGGPLTEGGEGKNERKDPRGKGRSDSGSFKTPPSSWQGGADEKNRKEAVGPRTEGLMSFPSEMEEKATAMENDVQSLEQAIGEEITMQLWKENEMLKAALKEAREEQQKRSLGSWSEVSGGQPVEVSTPRRRAESSRYGEIKVDCSLRWTPNGTQVPVGTPPDDNLGFRAPIPPPPPVPPFPTFEYYETEDVSGARFGKARLGMEEWHPGDGRNGDYWNRPVRRYVGAGGLQPQVDLRKAAEEVNARDAERHQGRAEHLFVCRPGDARALHPLDCRFGEDRAEHPLDGRPGGDRVEHPFDGHLGGDRALQLFPGLRGGDRALQSSANGRHGDRAQHGSDLPRQGDRACTLDPGCQGDELGMRYHGRGHGHQQLPNVSGGDPLEERGTSLVRGRERSPHDALRSNNPVLPRLPQYGTKTSSVDAADWIIEIQPIIGDMSNKATRWWTLTMETTMKTYERWLCATPLERLRLPPPNPVIPMMVGGDPMAVQRLEQRITTLLLPAVPDELRQDLVANRELWPSAIIYKVLRTYQPGGWSERSSLLAELTQVQVAKDPMQAANGLRLWKRQRARAIELGAGLPDLMLQVRALDSVVSKILPQHPQALFRVSAFRMETHIDERPTTESLLQFHELLQAEVDTLVHSTPGASGAEKPSAKAMQANQLVDRLAKDGGNGITPTSNDKIRPCKFWGTPEGCKHAKSCKFGHAALPDARERCWLCSSKDHRKSDCPYGKEAAGPQSGGSGKAGNGKGDGTSSSSVASGKGKGKYGGKNHPTTNDGVKKEVDSETNPKVASVGSNDDGADGEKASTGGSGDTNLNEASKKESELMSEVTGLLRSLRAAVKMCSIKRISSDEEEIVLLDGGATHCLRTCESEREWGLAKDIKVSLAEGETTMKQLPEAKTLLTKERVQPIVPVSMITMLGYKISWSSDGCTIHHPEKGSLPVTLVQGCPTVPSKVGRLLMKEIEEWHQQQCRVRSILAGEEKGQSPLHQRLDALRQLFPEVPSHLLQQVPGKTDWRGSLVPLSRRQRRGIERAKTLVVYAFSGPDYKDWVTVESSGVTVVCLDLLLGHNLLDADLCGWLEHVIETRGVNAWLLSPPCRTTSLCRHRDDGGPAPLRGLGLERFGRENLKASDQQKTDGDSILWLKALYWMWLSYRKDSSTRYLLENPRDPNEWHPQEGVHFPSFWQWPESERIRKELGLKKVHVEQGALGHITVKPTTFLTNFADVVGLQGLCCEKEKKKGSSQWPADVADRLQFSKKLASWAPGLKDLLCKSLVKLHRDKPSRVCKLTSAEVQEIRQWEEHVARGHCPYRRDCAVCVENRGRDRKHTRQDNVDAFCLSLDVSGPYEVGIDQTVKKPRYYLTGNITIPMCGENPLVEGLRELGAGLGQSSGALESSQLPLPSSTSSAQLNQPVETVTNGRGSGHNHGPEGQLKHVGADPDQRPDAVPDQGPTLSDRVGGPGVGAQCPLEQKPEDPFKEVGEATSPELTEVEVQEFDALDLQWKELLKTRPRVEVTNLTQSVPIRSRSPKDILEALALMMTRLQALQVPVARIHTDRAKEFVSQQFRKFVLSKGLLQSTTAGDEPSTNGRCEQELGVVRGLARAALSACGGPSTHWPLAIRHASETRMREQLRSMGVPCPPLLPLGLHAMAKGKRWHKTAAWGAPNVKVQLWGPCQDMSIGAGGYFAQLEDGKFIRTTAVIVPRWKSAPIGLQTVEAPSIGPMNPDEVLNQLPKELAPVNVQDLQCKDASGDDEYLGNFDPDPETGMIPQDEGIEIEGFVPGAEPLEVPIMLDVDEMELRAPVEKKNPPLRRRLHGKHTRLPDGQLSPALRKFALRAGGEWMQYVQWIEQWLLFQHRNLGGVLQEMLADLQEGAGEARHLGFDGFEKLQTEKHRLEASLKAAQVVEEEFNKEVTNEVLQTKTISMQEVRENYMDWVEPFAEEYSNLVQTVITPLDRQQLDEVLKTAVKVERVPGKLVATIKPPSKKRGRIVACGNFMSEVQGETSASGLDCIGLRAVLRKASDLDWEVSSLDVRRAFLNAPRLEQPGHVTLVDPPMLLQKMGVTRPQEVWQIRGALYGLCESPRDWSIHRDQVLRALRWKVGDTHHSFKETGERNLWRICDEKDSSTVGYLCVYVDDLMLTGPKSVLNLAMERLQSTWECSPAEWVNEQQSMRFCGFEVQRLPDGGLKLWQPNYIQDLMEKHAINREELVPCPKVTHAEPEDVQPHVLHQAQMLTGELQWLQSRTRPDLAYTCGVMSRLQHRRPSFVVEIGFHALRYLKRTWDFALCYRPCKPLDWGAENQLQCPRSMNQLEVYADSSFALEHEEDRSIQGTLIEQAGAAIQWSSSRQPFVAASTAESELISYAEAHQQALSIGSLMEILEYKPSYVLYGDNRSAISLATGESGPWRTRHLRLRASRLRDDLRTDQPDKPPSWSARHLPGELLVADGFTKPLAGTAFVRFVQRLGLEGLDGAVIKKMDVLNLSSKEKEQTWSQKAMTILQIGSLLHGAQGRVLAMVGRLLIAIGSWCLTRASGSNQPGSEVPTTSTSQESPRICAFRAPGDPSRDQHPIPPPRDQAQRLARAKAKSLGTAGRELHRHYDIPQPHVNRERMWWEDGRFDCWPVGADKWFQTREGLLVRTHNKPRRRSFHPLHRSVPIDVADLREERHTVIFPQDNQSQFVDPRPRFIESDSWSGNTTWSKDFRWRGYTVFILKSCQLDREASSGRVAHDPTLAAPRRANDRMFGGVHIHHEESFTPDEQHSQSEVRQGDHAAASSSDGYGSRAAGAPMINVTVNVSNSFGEARGGNHAASTPPAGSSGDSEFEFVTP